MKVYDIALMLIRALVALDLIREVSAIVIVIVRGAYVLLSEPNRAYLLPLEVADLIGPAIGIVVSLAILMLSRRIARFAARFAAPLDTAGDFH